MIPRYDINDKCIYSKLGIFVRIYKLTISETNDCGITIEYHITSEDGLVDIEGPVSEEDLDSCEPRVDLI